MQAASGHSCTLHGNRNTCPTLLQLVGSQGAPPGNLGGVHHSIHGYFLAVHDQAAVRAGDLRSAAASLQPRTEKSWSAP